MLSDNNDEDAPSKKCLYAKIIFGIIFSLFALVMIVLLIMYGATEEDSLVLGTNITMCITFIYTVFIAIIRQRYLREDCLFNLVPVLHMVVFIMACVSFGKYHYDSDHISKSPLYICDLIYTHIIFVIMTFYLAGAMIGSCIKCVELIKGRFHKRGDTPTQDGGTFPSPNLLVEGGIMYHTEYHPINSPRLYQTPMSSLSLQYPSES